MPNYLYRPPQTSYFTATETHFLPNKEVRKVLAGSSSLGETTVKDLCALNGLQH
jgi:hypothetical protein